MALLPSLLQEEDRPAGSRLGTILGGELRRLICKGLFIQAGMEEPQGQCISGAVTSPQSTGQHLRGYQHLEGEGQSVGSFPVGDPAT